MILITTLFISVFIIIVTIFFSDKLVYALHDSFSTRTWYKKIKHANTKEAQKAAAIEAIIVLGYALHRDGRITETLKERVRAGMDLLYQDIAPIIVFSGQHPGSGLRIRSESSAMMDAAFLTASPPKSLSSLPFSTSSSSNFLNSPSLPLPNHCSHFFLRDKKDKNEGMENKIPAPFVCPFERVERLYEQGRIILEEKSVSTRTNALESLSILERRRINWKLNDVATKPSHCQAVSASPAPERSEKRRIIVVTSPFHQIRSKWTFKKAIADIGLTNDVEIEMAQVNTVFHTTHGMGTDFQNRSIINQTLSYKVYDTIEDTPNSMASQTFRADKAKLTDYLMKKNMEDKNNLIVLNEDRRQQGMKRSNRKLFFIHPTIKYTTAWLVWKIQNRFVDWIDAFREFAALIYYWFKGYI